MSAPETLTPDEVRAIAPGDQVASYGDWYTVVAIDDLTESVSGDPVCHFTALLNTAPLCRWSGYAYPGTRRTSYRKAVAAIAAE